MKYEDFKLKSRTYYPVGSTVYTAWKSRHGYQVFAHKVKIIESWVAPFGSNVSFQLWEKQDGLFVPQWGEDNELIPISWDHDFEGKGTTVPCRYYYTTLPDYNGHFHDDTFASFEEALASVKRKRTDLKQLKSVHSRIHSKYPKIKLALESWVWIPKDSAPEVKNWRI